MLVTSIQQYFTNSGAAIAPTGEDDDAFIVVEPNLTRIGISYAYAKRKLYYMLLGTEPSQENDDPLQPASDADEPIVTAEQKKPEFTLIAGDHGLLDIRHRWQASRVVRWPCFRQPARTGARPSNGAA